MPKPKQDSVSAEKAPGAFLEDGRWSETAGLEHRGQTHRLVTALCRQRREGRITPELAAAAIQAANATVAFPNFSQWKNKPHWALAWTSTSAEEAVKREGRGIEGHWCGQRWLKGPEHDCHDLRHRETMPLEQVHDLLDSCDLREVPDPDRYRLTEAQVAKARLDADLLRGRSDDQSYFETKP